VNNALWTDVGESRATLPERQERAFLVALEDKHVGVMVTENGDDLACRAVPSPNPDYLGRVPQQEAPLVEIGILRDDREPMLGGVSPDGIVIGSLQANLADMRRARVEVREDGEETGREVLVEEQPHAGGTETNLRSRSAAKARQARMSSRVKSGKSRRISSSLIPDARYSRTSLTVIRRPRMQGFPPRLPDSTVIRERQSMAQDYGRRAGQVNLFRPATLAGAPAPCPNSRPADADQERTEA